MVDKPLVRRSLLIMLLGLLSSLQYKLWVAEGNVFDIWDRYEQLETLKQHNQALQHENKLIEIDIDELKYDEIQEVEERARMDFGMIKEGEVFYQIINEEHLSLS